MALFYVGPASAGSADGTSWANRVGSMTAAEALAGLAAGDTVYVGPGIYREKLTLSKSGGGLYATGTVAVTNGSKIVTGTGTAFSTSSNVIAGGQFQIQVVAHGTNGVTNNTSTFTSAGGNFQAGMIGMAIRINTVGHFIISAVASATSITIRNPDNSAVTPGTATALTYDVGPERPYNIASVDSGTQLTLDLPWTGPTLTLEAYQCWKDIKFIADTTGVNTDGIGGVVRHTGSTSDTAPNQSDCITGTSKNYRTFRGFMYDLSLTTSLLLFTTSTNIIVEDCVLTSNAGGGSVQFSGGSIHTVRRCIFYASKGSGDMGITWTNASVLDNIAGLCENCVFLGTNISMRSDRVGGIVLRYNTYLNAPYACRIVTSTTVGQGVHMFGNIIQSAATVGALAQVSGQVVEDFNSFFNNATDRTLVLVGASSNTNPTLFMGTILIPGYKLPERDVFSLAQQTESSLQRAITGVFPPPDDLFGMARPATNSKCSWGAIQFVDWAQSTVQAHAGTYSGRIADAGRVQFVVPVTNVSTIFSVWVYRESGYTGTLPQMVIKQPGVADTVIVDTGAAAGWNQLTTTLTPAALPKFVVVEVVSNNTATSGSFNTYVDDLTVL